MAIECNNLLGFLVGDLSTPVDPATWTCTELSLARANAFTKIAQITAGATPIERIGDEVYNTEKLLRGMWTVVKYVDNICGPIQSAEKSTVFSARSRNCRNLTPPGCR